MPKIFSNNINFIPYPLKKPAPKRPAPELWVMLEFTPYKVTLCDGEADLLDWVNALDPLAIFNLFFLEDIINKLI